VIEVLTKESQPVRQKKLNGLRKFECIAYQSFKTLQFHQSIPDESASEPIIPRSRIVVGAAIPSSTTYDLNILDHVSRIWLDFVAELNELVSVNGISELALSSTMTTTTKTVLEKVLVSKDPKTLK
jgi:hypothetical protein